MHDYRTGSPRWKRTAGSRRRSAIPLRVTAMTLALSLGACAADSRSDGLVAPPLPPSAEVVAADPSMVNALEVSYRDPSADSVRAEYTSGDGTDVGDTPWFAATAGVVPILGLRAGTQYLVTLQSRRGGSVTNGATISQTTAALPPALQAVSMTSVSGTLPSRGYTLTALVASDGIGYAVAFDSTGSVRWYRSIGRHDVMEAKQQPNGDYTVYVGSSRGYDPLPGGFVELRPPGDSVRTIQATGSPYTDGHDLIVATDHAGNRIADYLFGYDIGSIDLTSIGGVSNARWAGHQILRVAASGAVDTLVNGWTKWSIADVSDTYKPGDIDHPNSMSFDADGGLIVSFRNEDAIIKVDSATHTVSWQMGGVKNQFTMVGDPLAGFSGQHDVQMLPNGHLLMLDNGTNHSPQSSRVVEYSLDTIAKTATMVWQYAPSPSLSNTFTGSVQRLRNGNTTVAWTTFGLVDEVSPSGALVSRMRIWIAPGNPAVHSYRAVRIDNLYRYSDP